LHATVVDQLIESALSGNRPLRYWSEWHEALWMVVWGLAAGALGYHLRSPWHFAQALLAGAFALAAAYWFAFNSGWWIPVVAPAIAFFPAAALVTSYAAYEEHRQHDTLMRLFSWHVSPEIARALWKQRDQLMDGQRPRAQQLTATVLFTDIQGFSIISERMAPAQLFDWLNEYLQQMTGAIVDHHGVIRQFAGDAIIAIFGVPVPRRVADEIRQDARNAVRCALAMRNELARLNEQWERRRLPTISLRAGLFTGPLAAGSIGSSDRLEYAVIGDTVNTAARLESFNKEVANPDHSPDRIRILVGESTNDLLGEEFETKPMGSLRVKGKEKEVVVYQILGETKPLSHST
jgi:class 3 adenylate cyclase